MSPATCHPAGRRRRARGRSPRSGRGSGCAPVESIGGVRIDPVWSVAHGQGGSSAAGAGARAGGVRRLARAGGVSDHQERKRRAPGDSGVRWCEARKRYIAETTVGYDSRGKRIVRSGSGKTETAALRIMRQRVKDYEAGMVVGSDRYRVREAVEDWLRFGQGKVGERPGARIGLCARRTSSRSWGSGTSGNCARRRSTGGSRDWRRHWPPARCNLFGRCSAGWLDGR